MHESIRELIVEMREDEKRLRGKGADLIASGQLLATQYYRVKLETQLEEAGYNRPSVIMQECDDVSMLGLRSSGTQTSRPCVDSDSDMIDNS